MAAEYLANAVQEVSLNGPVIFSDTSIPCNRGYVYHENETGIFTLRGITNQCFATYQVTFNGNVALPEDAEVVTPIALAIAIQGEPRITSRAIFTPQSVSEYGNLTTTAIIKVPRGCCFTLSIDSVAAGTTSAPVIEVQNANLTITRIA